MIVKDLIKEASSILKKNMILSSLLDAEFILSDLLNVSREHLQVRDNLRVSETLKKKYKLAIERRARREPVAYILNKKEFWSLKFYVNESTLVPRPETELMVNGILDIYRNKNSNINILDIGTGSGCILISLLRELKFSKGIGLDISPKIVKVAKKNSQINLVSNRCTFVVSSIQNYVSGIYDLIVSNPPYIKRREIKNLSKEITRYEPFKALNGGIDGLDLIKKVIYKALKLLKRNGILAIEIGSCQYLKVSQLMRSVGLREISKVYDFNDNIRCIISTRV